MIRKTKIVVTLGPSTDLDKNIEKLIISGADIFRLNFSHGDFQEHVGRIEKIKKISYKLGKYVGILGDLQGPKLRVKTYKKENVELREGQKFILSCLSKELTNHFVGVINYEKILQDIFLKDILLLDDGKIQLKVEKIEKNTIFTKVLTGGVLANNKGINKLYGGLSAETLTKKDKKDIKKLSNMEINYLAISFPKNKSDILLARKLLKEVGSTAKIISKIERAEVVKNKRNIDEMILASDAIMIARGDLGVEIGYENLIKIQKQIILRSIELQKPVITATQMMESMTYNRIPTRAEVMDVANSVLDGTDCVMLSGETATGKYPVETVLSMSKICLKAEKIKEKTIRNFEKITNLQESIGISAIYISNIFHKIKAILAFSISEKVLVKMSKMNCRTPIFFVSENKKNLYNSILCKGIFPVFQIKNKKKFSLQKNIIEKLKYKKILKKNDLVVIIKKNTKTNFKKFFSIMKIFRVE
ncbi:pyruvate kinase [bacterium endosymbiont of Pedicinus badii]|uniref:pyruvate kinase n=1 Tax=bacterium endosymbiont of Pedicinus badii TaxID=1719126 RepID=UPI0009BBD5DB|nr:pyruvate kinase [bacterium endosymbiont of Pedicinus badii]OQM34427.1 hypothetical protein AOQ89_00870 [bacterium endosymbiont of Pedicinus badii]